MEITILPWQSRVPMAFPFRTSRLRHQDYGGNRASDLATGAALEAGDFMRKMVISMGFSW